jgi:hypothetical protein
MAKFSKIDYAGVKAVIAGIGKDCVKLNDRIQNAAVNIVLHTVEHGDERLAQDLYDAVTKGARRSALATWFQLYGPFSVEGKELKLDKAKRAGMTAADLDPAKLYSNAWFDATPEPELKPLDVEELFERLAKSVKAAEKGKREVRGVELLAALQDAHDKFHRDSAE